MKKSILVIFSIMATFNLTAQNQVPYLEAKLIPCSGDCSILSNVSELKLTDIKIANLETGMEDLFQCYIGTCTYQDQEVFWTKFGGGFSFGTMLKKDESTNIYHDTIKHVFNGQSMMISLELILDPSNNELKYSWLNGNGERCDNLTIIPLDNPLAKGKPFPDLTLEQLDGGKISTKDFANKIVVLNWWQVACAPCVAEMPGFNQLVEQYKDNPNIIFLAIGDDPKERIENCLSRHEFNYLQTIASKEARELFKNSYPKHIIINSSGIISYFATGGSKDMHHNIEKEINKLLK